MAWFTQDALDFLAEIELNNNREWFEANKKRYENSVKKPMTAFAEEMIARMSEIDPGISMKPKEAVSRIHRDTRFSKDKTPYKTRSYIVISAGGKKEFARPGLYFHLQATNCGIATGCYMPDPAQLSAIRHHIAANQEEFSALIADPSFIEKFGEVQGAKNKILPPDLKEAAAIQPLIFNKAFFYWTEFDSEAALRDDLPDRLMTYMRVAQPLNSFLARALESGNQPDPESVL